MSAKKQCDWVFVPPVSEYDTTYRCTYCNVVVTDSMDDIDDPTDRCYVNGRRKDDVRTGKREK